MPSPRSRAERREATARRILEAARAEFADRGVQDVTVRQVAARAGVDASLVMQHFGSKHELFLAAIDLGTEMPEGDLGAHFDRVLRARLDEPPAHTRALVRSMLTSPDAAAVMKGFLDDRVRNLVRSRSEGDDADEGEAEAELRAAVAVTSILGLVIGKHFLRLDALTDVTPDRIESILLPWLTSVAGTVAADQDDG